MSRTLCSLAKHRVIISDEAVYTNILHGALQAVTILFEKLILRYLFATKRPHRC